MSQETFGLKDWLIIAVGGFSSVFLTVTGWAFDKVNRQLRLVEDIHGWLKREDSHGIKLIYKQVDMAALMSRMDSLDKELANVQRNLRALSTAIAHKKRLLAEDEDD